METIPKSSRYLTLDIIHDSIVNTNLVVLDFSAEWCGPCKKMAPLIKRLSCKLPNVHFYKIDVADPDGAELSDDYEIGCLPTLCFLYQGKLVHRHEGFNSNDTALLQGFSQYLFKYDDTLNYSLDKIYTGISRGLNNISTNLINEPLFIIPPWLMTLMQLIFLA